MAAEPNVIVAVRQPYDLTWLPGMTPPNPEAIARLYPEDAACNAVIHFVDPALVAASVEAGLLWWGFVIGLAVGLLALLITRVRWGPRRTL